MKRIVNWLLIRCWICFIIFLLMERTIQFEAPTLIIPAHGHLVQNRPRTKNTKFKWNEKYKLNSSRANRHKMENPPRTKKIQNGLKGDPWRMKQNFMVYQNNSVFGRNHLWTEDMFMWRPLLNAITPGVGGGGSDLPPLSLIRKNPPCSNDYISRTLVKGNGHKS